jgi:hypothetical protein
MNQLPLSTRGLFFLSPSHQGNFPTKGQRSKRQSFVYIFQVIVVSQSAPFFRSIYEFHADHDAGHFHQLCFHIFICGKNESLNQKEKVENSSRQS